MLGPLVEVEMLKKCVPFWREARSEAKLHTARNSRVTFGSWDVEKVHAIVVRSTFRRRTIFKNYMLGLVLDVQIWFCVAGASTRDA